MASEKTPLLIKSLKDEVVVKIAEEFDENNNNIKIMTSLTYEELLPYLIDPYWIRIRKIFFTLTWTAFIVMLLAACISSFTSTTTCRNVSTMIHASSTDKSFMMNETADELKNGLVSLIFNGVEKSGDNHF